MDDSTILRMFRERDEQALFLTQEKYGAYCRTVARNILGGVEDAEECVNTTLLKAWDAIPPTEPRSLQAFLCKITRNTALDAYERDKAAKRGGGRVAAALSEIGEVAGADSVEQTVESGVFADVLNGFLSELALEPRIIFLKRYLYFHSVGEIANALGVGESKVKSVLFRLRKTLKSKLEKDGFLP